jgi:two-component system, NarL family, response regulator YdfI
MIRVFVIAQSIVTQAGLTTLLISDVEIVGSAVRPATIAPAIEADVILLEQEAIAQLTDIEIPIVMLVEESSAIAEYLQAGIRSILPNDVSAEELTEAIKATAAGLTVLHPDFVQGLFAPIARVPEPVPLSPREIEVLGMLAEGLGNRAIAQQLNLSEHTVKFHISSIFSKLEVSSRTEAVIMGARQGWILL